MDEEGLLVAKFNAGLLTPEQFRKALEELHEDRNNQ